MERSNEAIRLGKASVKVEQTIKSCLTYEQLNASKNMMNNWERLSLQLGIKREIVEGIKSELKQTLIEQGKIIKESVV